MLVQQHSCSHAHHQSWSLFESSVRHTLYPFLLRDIGCKQKSRGIGTIRKGWGMSFCTCRSSATRIELLRQLTQLDTCVIFAASGSFDVLAHERNCHLCKRPSIPACCLFPSPVQCYPCSYRPPLLHCCCADDTASVACSCRERQFPSKRQACNGWTWLKYASALRTGMTIGIA
jgi:hypothetical protein